MAQRLLKNRRYHVDLRGTTQHMGRTIRIIARRGMTWLAALSMLTATHAQSTQQLSQLEQLSPTALSFCAPNFAGASNGDWWSWQSASKLRQQLLLLRRPTTLPRFDSGGWCETGIAEEEQ